MAALEHDVRASLSVAAEGDIRLWLQGSYGSEAFGWEHCPVLHAEATVNDLPMYEVSAGAWHAPSGTLLSGQGGNCAPMQYQLLDPPADLLATVGVRIEVRDEGGAIELEVPFIGTPELALAEPRVLIPGERAELEVVPTPLAIDPAMNIVTYEGELAEKMPGNAKAWFRVNDLEGTETGVAFTVPEMQLGSRGRLKLLPLTTAAPGTVLPITRCKGVGGCFATRVPGATDGVELSISASGAPVEPDSTEDPAQWRACWLSGEVTGGAELEWTYAGDCFWSLLEGRVLQATFHEGPYDSFSLRIDDFVAEEGARLHAQVEVKEAASTWQHADCTVRIERVWSDIPADLSTVVEGTGACVGPTSASTTSVGPIAIEPFAFRVPSARRP